MRRLALLFLLVGCGGDSSGPDQTPNLTGTWIGQYTNTANPGIIFQAVMQLEDNGAITGTLTTNAGRSASVDGFTEDGRFEAVFDYTDDCTGEASTTADVVEGGTRLVGNYASDDCVGETAGGYSLTRVPE